MCTPPPHGSIPPPAPQKHKALPNVRRRTRPPHMAVRRRMPGFAAGIIHPPRSPHLKRLDRLLQHLELRVVGLLHFFIGKFIFADGLY